MDKPASLLTASTPIITGATNSSRPASATPSGIVIASSLPDGQPGDESTVSGDVLATALRAQHGIGSGNGDANSGPVSLVAEADALGTRHQELAEAVRTGSADVAELLALAGGAPRKPAAAAEPRRTAGGILLPGSPGGTGTGLDLKI